MDNGLSGLQYISGPVFKKVKPLLAILFVLLTGCFQQSITYTPEPLAQETAKPTAKPTLVPTFTPQLLTPPYDVWVDTVLPESARALISQQPEFNLSTSQDQALMAISTEIFEKEIGSWTYLLVAPLYSSLENISFSTLYSAWTSESMEIPDFNILLMSEETKLFLTNFWGVPLLEDLIIVEPDQLLEEIWYDASALAIIPFERLEPSFKVISIDTQNPLTSSADNDNYPLTFQLYLSVPDKELVQSFQVVPITNFDPSKLTSIAMTGVTAMVRDTAAIMEEKGIRYPGDDIREVLVSADITHINNEVPFATDCPPPDSNQDSLSFCSSDLYIELLESIGTDIVELSGDHFSDYGPEAMFHTLDIYNQYGLIVYGGGKTLQDGLEPVFIEHNGNRIAFIGCNAKSDERYGTASLTEPGASKCDFDWMIPEIRRLSDDGYLVISTMQHEEVDSFFPIALQLYDFRRLSEAGASIVSGSQAHHPQGIEIDWFKIHPLRLRQFIL